MLSPWKSWRGSVENEAGLRNGDENGSLFTKGEGAESGTEDDKSNAGSSGGG